MDWFRYAESHGSEGDPVINNAWMYRDYLIRALNADVPYDQLVREHLAGDLLEDPRVNPELGLNESILGTIQLRMVFHGFSPTDALDEKVRFVDDQVNTLSKALLGLTVSCARCHDHKFDAISQADYYAIFGIFAACRPARQLIDLPARLNKNRDQLADLKPKIRHALADDWIGALDSLESRLRVKLTEDVPADSLLDVLQEWDESKRQVVEVVKPPSVGGPLTRSTTKITRRWNFAEPIDYAEWHHYGVGSSHQPSEAGEFSIAPDGDLALTGVHPAGIYSHKLSSKHPARLTSPDVVLDEEYDYWVRAIGAGGARTRYVVQDYPRTGTVYPATKLTPQWTWHRLNLDYWQGDTVHFELATGKDIPLLVEDKPRSWFGVSEARIVPHDSSPPATASPFRAAFSSKAGPIPVTVDGAIGVVAASIADAVESWRQSNCSNAQAELIDHCLRIGLLENRLEFLPTARTLVQQYRAAEDQIPIPRRVPGVENVPVRKQPLYIRGNHKQPASIVPRRFLSAVDDQPYPGHVSGRLQLAEDILRDDNPLARRVIVNRIWHHLFGAGIVATPDNFGRLGAEPTHPRLLDYLATRFAHGGWSLKAMSRFIVTAQTWQQSSQPAREAIERDPDNELLSHANIRRLEAEAIRDALLVASGELDLATSGPPVDAGSSQRSIFLRVHRNALNPMLRAFDFPEPFAAVGRRDVTNVPAQSLLMMNSPQIARYAAGLARQVTTETPNDSERIRRCYQRLFSRPPSAAETDMIADYLVATRDTLQQRRSELNRLREQRQELQTLTDSIVEPKRQELTARESTSRPTALAKPLARWDFGTGWDDQVGVLDAEPQRGAQRIDGELVLTAGGYAVTAPLGKTLTAKTLEVWVRLATLDQRGGGVMTVQTADGRVFDSIVFGEKRPGHWLAGSDHHSRTEPFVGAPPEEEAAESAVHLAIAYYEDGTVIGYRNGRRYGKPFRTRPPIVYESGESLVSFGVRHLPAHRDRCLDGSLVSASLYDRALNDEEIRRSFEHASGRVSDAAVLAELDPESRNRVEAARQAIDEIDADVASIGEVPESDHELSIWIDVAKSMLMAKEFVYVR